MPKSTRSPYVRAHRRCSPQRGEPPFLEASMARIQRREQIQSVGPCDACRHVQRCSGSDLACEALELFRNAGRVSMVAARQPSRVIFERMMEAAATPRLSPEERRQKREERAVRIAREMSYADFGEL
jgi:hypothetical protein